jgi:3-oxoadipate enol-lactonase
MPTVRVDGNELYYEQSGAGPKLLFLNGSGATLATVSPIIGLLGQQFAVVAYDQRGLGRSSLPDHPYAMADCAADALGVADHLGWEHFSVMGVSFGGMVAQEVAITAPERIERLALCCTSSGGAGGASYPLHTLGGRSTEEQLAIRIRLLDTRFTPEWLGEHESDRALLAMMAKRVEAVRSEEVLRGEALQLEARRAHDTFERLTRITCPTLVASGRFDGIAPPENGAAIAKQLADADYRVYEGGHLFFAQDPTALPEITQFLADR